MIVACSASPYLTPRAFGGGSGRGPVRIAALAVRAPLPSPFACELVSRDVTAAAGAPQRLRPRDLVGQFGALEPRPRDKVGQVGALGAVTPRPRTGGERLVVGQLGQLRRRNRPGRDRVRRLTGAREGHAASAGQGEPARVARWWLSKSSRRTRPGNRLSPRRCSAQSRSAGRAPPRRRPFVSSARRPALAQRRESCRL